MVRAGVPYGGGLRARLQFETMPIAELLREALTAIRRITAAGETYHSADRRLAQLNQLAELHKAGAKPCPPNSRALGVAW